MKQLVELFHSPLSLRQIEDRTGVDQRRIRRIWRQEFGDDAVGQRGIRMRQNASSASCRKNIAHDEFMAALKSCSTTSEAAGRLGVSKSYVYQRASSEGCLSIVRQNAFRRRSQAMRVLRAPHALSAETIGKVVALADSELTVKEIAETTGISPSSVHGIFKNSLPCAQYERRQRRMRMLRQKRSLQGLEKAGRLGSASERAFHRLLSLMLCAKVRHHDVDLLPPYEIDITIPAARIAVLWDGIGHFKPIFGQAMFEKVRFRDAWKRRALARMGWKVFAVKDMNSRMRAVFLEKQAQRLALMLETEKLGHLIRRF